MSYMWWDKRSWSPGLVCETSTLLWKGMFIKKKIKEVFDPYTMSLFTQSKRNLNLSRIKDIIFNIFVWSLKFFSDYFRYFWLWENVWSHKISWNKLNMNFNDFPRITFLECNSTYNNLINSWHLQVHILENQSKNMLKL